MERSNIKIQLRCTHANSIFRFVSHNDILYVPWKGNDAQLNALLALVETHKTATNASGKTQEFFFTPEITTGTYKNDTVDGGSATVTEKSHTLQVGDFYMSDGSLVGKDEDLTDAQQANCIGIVFQVHNNEMHGEVIALHNADYDYDVGVLWDDATRYAKDYLPVAPIVTSGWLLPSYNQWRIIYNYRGAFCSIPIFTSFSIKSSPHTAHYWTSDGRGSNIDLTGNWDHQWHPSEFYFAVRSILTF